MDGRDLFNEVCKNYNEKITLTSIANEIPKFVNRVVTSKVYNFYGTFHLGALYDMKNFSNMLVRKFFFKNQSTSYVKKTWEMIRNQLLRL